MAIKKIPAIPHVNVEDKNLTRILQPMKERIESLTDDLINTAATTGKTGATGAAGKNGAPGATGPAGPPGSGGSMPTTMQANLVIPDHTQALYRRRIVTGPGLRITIGADAALVSV